MLRPYSELKDSALEYFDAMEDAKGEQEFLESLEIYEKMNIRE